MTSMGGEIFYLGEMFYPLLLTCQHIVLRTPSFFLFSLLKPLVLGLVVPRAHHQNVPEWIDRYQIREKSSFIEPCGRASTLGPTGCRRRDFLRYISPFLLTCQHIMLRTPSFFSCLLAPRLFWELVVPRAHHQSIPERIGRYQVKKDLSSNRGVELQNCEQLVVGERIFLCLSVI